MRIFIVFCLAAFPLCVSAQDELHKLHVAVTGAKQEGKTIYVAVFRPEDRFPKEEGAWKHGKVIASNGEGSVELELPFGDYAIAVFLDENGNGKLDKNALGFPKEQFGFSNDFRPRTGAPKFKNCRFAFSEANGAIAIRLLK